MGKLDKLKSQIPQGSQELSTKNHLAKTEIAMSFQNEGTELTRILLRNIEFNPHNLWSCNDDDESIQQLADAIERNGLLHNIVVSQREDGTFMLLSGERRVKALRLLQKREQESDPTGQKAHKWDRVQAQTYTGLDELSEHRDIHFSLHSFPTRRSSDLYFPVFGQFAGEIPGGSPGCRGIFQVPYPDDGLHGPALHPV